MSAATDGEVAGATVELGAFGVGEPVPGVGHSVEVVAAEGAVAQPVVEPVDGVDHLTACRVRLRLAGGCPTVGVDRPVDVMITVGGTQLVGAAGEVDVEHVDHSPQP